MMKRILALVLCLATVLVCLAGCSHGEDDKGAYIRMYLSEPVYDLDPLTAFDNEASLQIISLLFEGLFYADEDGKPKKGLVDDYDYIVDKEHGTYTLSLKLKSTNWSDGVALSANDVQFTFRRLFENDVQTPVTALLYDIRNARAVAAGDDSIDHLAVVVVDSTTVEIEFERDIDIDAFLLTLCSPALYPLRDDIVSTNADWAKKKSSGLVCSGPFMVRAMDFDEKDGFILERNSYYYRDRQKDDLDKYVTPFRIIVDYVTDPVEQLKLFGSGDTGAVYYFGHIPLSARNDESLASILKKVDVSSTPSTHVYYLNENAVVNGEQLFAKKEVREALSLVIDRDEIVKTLVYAEAADGLVPWSILNRTDKSTEFRKKASSYISSVPNVDEAKELLRVAGVNPSDYSFSITVAAYDEDHVAAAQLVSKAWNALGFKVTVNALSTYMRTETTLKVRGALDTNAINAVTAALYELDTVRNVKATVAIGDGTTESTTTFAVTAGKQLRSYVIEDAVTALGLTIAGTASVSETGIYENPYRDALTSGDYEVIARDLVATSTDPFGYLAPFATAYSGNGYRAVIDEDGQTTYVLNPHETGFENREYNALIEDVANASKAKDRARLLHEAEAILIDEMPVIPVVYNQKTTLVSSKLSKVDERLYYTNFAKTNLSGYWKIALAEKWVTDEKKK